jgi:hypothetical protein
MDNGVVRIADRPSGCAGDMRPSIAGLTQIPWAIVGQGADAPRHAYRLADAALVVRVKEAEMGPIALYRGGATFGPDRVSPFRYYLIERGTI